jgi:hypothetical protein
MDDARLVEKVTRDVKQAKQLELRGGPLSLAPDTGEEITDQPSSMHSLVWKGYFLRPPRQCVENARRA